MYRNDMIGYKFLRYKVAATVSAYSNHITRVPFKRLSWQQNCLIKKVHIRQFSGSTRNLNNIKLKDDSSRVKNKADIQNDQTKVPLVLSNGEVEKAGTTNLLKTASTPTDKSDSQGSEKESNLKASLDNRTGEVTTKINNTDTTESGEVNDVEGQEMEDDTEGYLTTIFDGMEPYLDTYEVYIELVNAGFTEKQANSLMNFIIVQINTKASKLAEKYEQIYELENEKYLFESAQEELRVDSTRSREQHINELIALTHILERDFTAISDELNNGFLEMKNETTIAMNDSKLENTLNSKKIYLSIQETNHKITTELISLMRSEIETLRWNLSRWGIMAILASVFSGFATFYIYKARVTKKQQASKNQFGPLVIYEPSELDEDDYHTDLDEYEVS